jgi:hypothetical protein
MVLEKIIKNVRISVISFGIISALFAGITGCRSYEEAIQSKKQYIQEPVRDLSMDTEIDWNLEYTPSDPNAAIVYSQEAPDYLLASLNALASEDNNNFVKSSGTPTVILWVYEYSDKDKTNPRNSLMAKLWAFGHKELIAIFRTKGYTYDMLDQRDKDLANQIYYWFHNGWHINNSADTNNQSVK